MKIFSARFLALFFFALTMGMGAHAWGQSSAAPTPEDKQAKPAAGEPVEEEEVEETHQTAPGSGGTTEADPVEVSTGAFLWSKTALEIPGRGGLDLKISFRYNNQNWVSPSSAGARWSVDYLDEILSLDAGDPPLTPPKYKGPPTWFGGHAADTSSQGGQAASAGGGGGAGGNWWSPPSKAWKLYHHHDLRIDSYTYQPKKPGNLAVGTAGLFTKIRQVGAHGYWSGTGPNGNIQVINPTPPDGFELREPDGRIRSFGLRLKSCTGQYVYRLTSIRDRMGNEILLEYDLVGKPNPCFGKEIGAKKFYRLKKVIDSYGRSVFFEYEPNGDAWLRQIREEPSPKLLGRTVVLDHDADGNLTSLALPSISVFPTGASASPTSRIYVFTYSSKTPTNNPLPHSGHNILKITDPNEIVSGFAKPYVENVYDDKLDPSAEGYYPEGFRVIRQILGSDATHPSGVTAGGIYDFHYDMQPLTSPSLDHGWFKERMKTLVIDPNGNTRLYYMDELQRERLSYQFAGRLNHLPNPLPIPYTPPAISEGISPLVTVNPASPSTADRLTAPAVAALGSMEPSVGCTFLQKEKINGLNQVLVERGADWRREYVYDESSPDVFQRANLILEKEISNSATNPSHPIVRAYAYEPLFNQIRAAYDPRGLDPSFVPPNGTMSISKPDRYSRKWVYDYQEGPQSNVQSTIDTWKIDLFQSEMSVTLQDAGITPVPFFTFGIGDNMGNSDGTTSQIVGNAIRIDSQANVLTNASAKAKTVNPSFAIPHQSVTWLLRHNAFGLLKEVVDPAGSSTRLSYFDLSSGPSGLPGASSGEEHGGFLASVTRAFAAPEQTVTQFARDVLARPIQVVNGRGYVTNSIFNERGDLVESVNPRGYRTALLYDANGNVTEKWITNSTPILASGTYLPPTGNPETLPTDIKSFYTYDILDHLVKERQQIAPGTAADWKHRYDKSGNRVLTLEPEWHAANNPGNLKSIVFDEWSRVFTESSGGVTGQFAGLDANSALLLGLSLPTPANLATTTHYFALEKKGRTKDGEGKSVHYDYDEFNRLVKMTNDLGDYQSFTLDPAGQSVKTESFDGPTSIRLAMSLQAYDELGRVYQRDQAWLDRNGVLDFTLDPGQLTPADGYATMRFALDARGLATAVVDDNASFGEFDFDRLGRVVESRDGLKGAPGVNFTTFSYDSNGNAIYSQSHEVASNNPSEQQIQKRWNFHDELDRLVATSDAFGKTSRFLYDSRGNLVFQSDPNSQFVNLNLDSLNSWSQHASLPSLTVNDHGNVSVTEYDLRSLPLRTRRPMLVGGKGMNPVDMNQSGGLIETNRSFDLNGRLTGESDDSGNVTSYGYDALNRKTSVLFADGTSQQFVYLKNHLIDSATDANGVLTNLEYDSANRLTEKLLPPGIGGADYVLFSYDGLGRISEATNKIGSTQIAKVTREYDSLSRVTKEKLKIFTSPNGTTLSSYDGVGNLLSCTYPGLRKVDRSYDLLNRLSLISDQNGTIADYEYLGGRVKSRTHGNSTRLDVGYELNIYNETTGRPLETKHSLGTNTKDYRKFTWDRANNKISRKDDLTGLLHSYSYDSAYRMIASNQTGGGLTPETLVYNLDGVGNRASVTGGSQAGAYAMLPGAADDKMNQYTTTPFDARTYDNNGNLKSSAKASGIIYDANNQMLQFNDATGKVHKYDYDAFGRRIRKIVDKGNSTTEETQYFYLPGFQVGEERDAAGATLATYVYGNGIDTVISMRRDVVAPIGATEDYYYHSDDMGNVFKLTNASGTVVEQYRYKDYGEVTVLNASGSQIGATAFKNPYRFNGRNLDEETGLYYYRARYMDPQTGRFTSRDPLGIWGDAGNLGNGLSYAGNNPWSSLDPTGLITRSMSSDFMTIYNIINASRPEPLTTTCNSEKEPANEKESKTGGGSQGGGKYKGPIDSPPPGAPGYQPESPSKPEGGYFDGLGGAVVDDLVGVSATFTWITNKLEGVDFGGLTPSEPPSFDASLAGGIWDSVKEWFHDAAYNYDGPSSTYSGVDYITTGAPPK